MAIKAGRADRTDCVLGGAKDYGKALHGHSPGEIQVEFLSRSNASKYSLEERETLNERIRAALAAGPPPEAAGPSRLPWAPNSSASDEQNGEANDN